MILFSKKLHLNTSVFFEDPYVVRLNHADHIYPNLNLSDFRRILKYSRNHIHGSWGYTAIEYEGIAVPADNSDELSLASVAHSLLFQPIIYKAASYWVFEDDEDALQFLLFVGESSERVYMWPQNRTFTIYEVINKD